MSGSQHLLPLPLPCAASPLPGSRETSSPQVPYSPCDLESSGFFSSLSIGGGGCTATFGQYKGIVLTGTKKALTVEQCTEQGIVVYVESGYDYKGEKLGEKGHFSKEVKTTEEFIQTLKECKEHVGNTGVSVTIYLKASENTMKWMRKRLFSKTKKEKTKKEVDHYFTIYIPENGS